MKKQIIILLLFTFFSSNITKAQKGNVFVPITDSILVEETYKKIIQDTTVTLWYNNFELSDKINLSKDLEHQKTLYANISWDCNSDKGVLLGINPGIVANFYMFFTFDDFSKIVGTKITNKYLNEIKIFLSQRTIDTKNEKLFYSRSLKIDSLPIIEPFEPINYSMKFQNYLLNNSIIGYSDFALQKEIGIYNAIHKIDTIKLETSTGTDIEEIQTPSTIDRFLLSDKISVQNDTTLDIGYRFLMKSQYIVKRIESKRGLLFNNGHIIWFSKNEFDNVLDEFFKKEKTFNFLKLYIDNDFYKTIEFRLF